MPTCTTRLVAPGGLDHAPALADGDRERLLARRRPCRRRQAAIVWMACQWSGVAMTTASMSFAVDQLAEVAEGGRLAVRALALAASSVDFDTSHRATISMSA